MLNDFMLISYGLFCYLTYTDTAENKTSLNMDGMVLQLAVPHSSLGGAAS